MPIPSMPQRPPSRVHPPTPPLLSAIALLVALGAGATHTHAAGEVTAVEITETPAVPSSYVIDDTTVEWGLGFDLSLDAFIVNGERHVPVRTADRTEVRRIDRPGVSTGTPCGVFAETLDESGARLAPGFPALPDGNCDTEALLASDLVNRGTLDIFSNRSPTAKNIERVDFLFDSGVNAPFDPSASALAGHLVGDKSGNNTVQMAAVLALDESGLPSAYGPLVRVNPLRCAADEICFGSTGLVHDYAFLQSASLPPPGLPALLTRFNEPVGLAYVSADDLGLDAGQRYHGVSLFAADVDASVHDLLMPSTFPGDTEDGLRDIPGDSIDLYGGGAAHYVADAASLASGRVTCSVPGGTRAVGIAGIDVNVHADMGGDGILDPDTDRTLGDPVASGFAGRLDVPALSDGSYLLQIDMADPDLTPETSITSASMLPFVIAGSDVDALDFSLDCPDLADPPQAMADTVTLVQSAPGEPVPPTRIDVLANDIDPLGQGLTIVAVAGAANGEIEITEDGGAVVYTPDPGFNGQDTFEYTVEDAAGRSDSVTVTVAVDLIADDDPNCVGGGRVDGCTILTELDGNGLGHLQGLSLLGLTLILLGRRARRERLRPLRADTGERP